jgi:autotransporter-associated beta strand protein
MVVPAARAANFTWLGTGGDTNWSTAANWDTGAAPGNGDKLIFDASSGTNLTSNNDVGVLNNLDLQLSNTVGGNVTISGTSFRVGSLGIYNLSSYALNINTDITLSSSASFSVWRSGGSINLNGNVSLVNRTLSLQCQVSGSQVSHVVAGTISGSGGLTYSASGNTVCEIRAAQTYTGTTRLMNNATIRLAGAGSLPNRTYVLLNDAGTTLDLNGVSDTVGHIAGNGRVLLGGATLTTGGDNSTSSLNGAISGNGNLIKEGTGAFMLRGNNTYSGFTRINSGSILTLKKECIPDGSAVILNGTASLSLSGTTETIGSLSGEATTTVNTGNTTLRTGGDGTSTTYAGVIAGNGGLTKQGGGVFTLTGVNTYSGATTVEAGTLRLNGGANRLRTNTNLTVAAGAVLHLDGCNQSVRSLAGSGTVTTTGGGVLTISRTLEPGASPGVLTVGNFALDAGATTNVELDGSNPGTQYDQIVATGDVSLNGTLSVSLGFTPAKGQSFTLIDKTSAGPVAGTFSGLAEGATLTVGGINLRISYVGGDGNDVTLTRPASSGGGPGPRPRPRPTPTPEPSPRPRPRPAPHVGPDESPSPNHSTQGPALNWGPVSGASFYRIYRAACPTCPKEQVGRVAGTSFTDTSAQPGQVYYYFLRSEDEGGESDYSDWVPAWRYDPNPGRSGDYNGDGVMDLLWWNQDGNQLQVWFLEGGQIHQVSSLGGGEDISQWLLVDTGDYNGDGV